MFKEVQRYCLFFPESSDRHQVCAALKWRISAHSCLEGGKMFRKPLHFSRNYNNVGSNGLWVQISQKSWSQAVHLINCFICLTRVKVGFGRQSNHHFKLDPPFSDEVTLNWPSKCWNPCSLEASEAVQTNNRPQMSGHQSDPSAPCCGVCLNGRQDVRLQGRTSLEDGVQMRLVWKKMLFADFSLFILQTCKQWLLGEGTLKWPHVLFAFLNYL